MSSPATDSRIVYLALLTHRSTSDSCSREMPGTTACGLPHDDGDYSANAAVDCPRCLGAASSQQDS